MTPLTCFPFSRVDAETMFDFLAEDLAVYQLICCLANVPLGWPFPDEQTKPLPFSEPIFRLPL